MNNEQLIVLWFTGLFMSLAFIFSHSEFRILRQSWLNNRQLVIVWLTGLFLSLAFIFSHYEFRYDSPEKVPVFYKLLKRNSYRVSGVRSWYYRTRAFREIYPLLLMSVPPILIVQGFLIYTLRSKKKN